MSSCRPDWASYFDEAFQVNVSCTVAIVDAAWAAMSATISSADRDSEGCFDA